MSELKITGVKVMGDFLEIKLSDDRALYRPVILSERLANATLFERENFTILGDGQAIHWPDVDEDLSLRGFLDDDIDLSPDDVADGLLARGKRATGGRWISPWRENPPLAFLDSEERFYTDSGDPVIEAFYYDGARLGITEENADYIEFAQPENTKILAEAYAREKKDFARFKEYSKAMATSLFSEARPRIVALEAFLSQSEEGRAFLETLGPVGKPPEGTPALRGER